MIWVNNCKTTLAQALAAGTGTTVIYVPTGIAAQLNTAGLSATSPAKLTLTSATLETAWEVVLCTAAVTGTVTDTLTITRVAETTPTVSLGGTGPAWPAGSVVDLRATAAQLSAFTGFGSGPGRKNLAPFLYECSVIDFGADPTGATDSSAAILATVNAAASLTGGADNSQATVHFPAGIYLVSQTAVLTPTVVTGSSGINFVGDGYTTSILRYAPGLSGPCYFYDNGSTNRTLLSTFRDLGFEGGTPAALAGGAVNIQSNANGFRMYATSGGVNEQNFRFTNCRMTGLNVMFDFEGTNLASEIRHTGCSYTDWKTAVYRVNNPQSFNHEFFGCDIEGAGDFFQVQNGGAIKVFGGNMIMLPDSYFTTPQYFLRGTGTPGAGAFPITFYGLRMELRTSLSNLAALSTVQQFNVHFNQCMFEDQTVATSIATTATTTAGTVLTYASVPASIVAGMQVFNTGAIGPVVVVSTTSTTITVNQTVTVASGVTTPIGAKTAWLTVGSYSAVTFNQCAFYQFNGVPVNFVLTSSGQYGESGSIYLNNSLIPNNFSDQCFISSYVGTVRARDCYSGSIGVLPSGTHYAMDFDLHPGLTSTAGLYTAWPGGGVLVDASNGNPSWHLKTVEIKLTGEYWPNTSGGEHFITLPAQAVIKNIHIRKPAGSADTTVTQVQVTNNSKSVQHLATTSQAFNLAATADLTNYFYCVGNALNDRTLRLSVTNATTGNINGGVAIVEYY